MKYKCGNEVMVGDTILRIENPAGVLEVGGKHIITGFREHSTTIIVEDCTSKILSPSCFKLIKRKEKEMLERTEEYDVKLTGEEIAFVTMMFAVTSCNVTTERGDLAMNAYKKFKDFSGGFERYGLVLPSIVLGSHTSVLATWLDKVFTPPETEDQKKLRELKEAHEELGKKIEAMEKK